MTEEEKKKWELEHGKIWDDRDEFQKLLDELEVVIVWDSHDS